MKKESTGFCTTCPSEEEIFFGDTIKVVDGAHVFNTAVVEKTKGFATVEGDLLSEWLDGEYRVIK
jgi:hypothetical protein